MGSLLSNNIQAETPVGVEQNSATTINSSTIQEKLELQQDEEPHMKEEQQHQPQQKQLQQLQHHTKHLTSTPIRPPHKILTPNMSSVYKFSTRRRTLRRNSCYFNGSTVSFTQPQTLKKENKILEPMPTTSSAAVTTETNSHQKPTKPELQYLKMERVLSHVNDPKNKGGGDFPKWNLRI